MYKSERLVLNNNKIEVSEESLNVSFSSKNSFYKKLNNETKRDIIFLIKSGYDKEIIIKLYLFAKPSNLNEAVHYLTKENGIYQHKFYNSLTKEELCEICGEKEIMHNNEIDENMNFSLNMEKTNNIVLRKKTKEEKKNICIICEENVSKVEEIQNKCDECGNYFCNECLYLNIKELIKNGKYPSCPKCKYLYTKDKIEQILLFNTYNKEEVNNLKQLLEKNKTKEIIFSNPEFMFCPIVNCNGFAKKNNEKENNICNMGHKFCSKCGELWHNNGKCKEAEKVDILFKQFHKKYHLKNCPYCGIETFKKGGCNHMKCQYCNQDWCWLCKEILNSIEGHYGNMNNQCYNRMMENNNLEICSKCENEINVNSTKTFNCGHIICKYCFIKYLLESNIMILYPQKIINCIILGCKGIKLIKGNDFIQFINETNNKKLLKKYQNIILFYEYLLCPYFINEYGNYINIYGDFIDFITKKIDFSEINRTVYTILEIIGCIFGLLFFLIYLIIFPIFPLYAIKKLFYCKFLPEIEEKFNNKVILFSVLLGEEILSLVFIFSLIIIHYIYTILFLPILIIIILIRNKIYDL